MHLSVGSESMLMKISTGQIAKVANNEQQNDNEEIALSEFSYDVLGRLVQSMRWCLYMY